MILLLSKRGASSLTNQCVWVGASGTRYVYMVYQLPKKFMDHQHGNYIYCKIVDNAWVPVYIGHGDLSHLVGENHHRIKCIQQRGGTHVHVRYNEHEKDRLREEVDLLGHYPQAYSPAGCNMKAGNSVT